MSKKESKPSIVPLADRVLLQEITQEEGGETASGIIIPETVEADKGAKRGKVLSVGPGRYEDGKRIPPSVKVGDEVLFQWGDKFTMGGDEYYIVSESSIMAVVKK